MSLTLNEPMPAILTALPVDPILVADAVSSADSIPSSPSLPVGPALAGASAAAAIKLVMATTPKRGAVRKQPKEPSTLYAYAVEQGGRIDLTVAAKAELVQRGLPEHRISNAAYGIRKCFGKTVTAIRSGRTVVAYQVEV